MVFKVSDLHDLVDLLETHPQWRAQLRRLLLSKDVLALPRIVQELAVAQQRLAEAQQRTEQRVEELAVTVRELGAAQQRLAEAQQRSEQRVEELAVTVRELGAAQQRLAEAQQRTEQRVEELAVTVRGLGAAQQRLAEAQQRTEQRVEELAVTVRELGAAQQRLAEAQQRTEARLDRLDNRVGVSVEDEATDVLRVVLERKGYRALRSGYNLALDGEVDVVLPLHDPQGQPVWAVLEAKVRLGRRAVEAWAKRMSDANFQAALRAAGIPGPYLVYAYGMRIDESARDAAEEFGIGLLSSRGEEVPPAPSPNV